MTVTFTTNGKGYWSPVATAVTIKDILVTYCNEDKSFGELAVFFDTASWDTEHDGLIYTDNQFLNELRVFLATHGLNSDVDYSEQGMQGDDYVSLDIGKEFIASWEAKFGEVTVL